MSYFFLFIFEDYIHLYILKSLQLENITKMKLMIYLIFAMLLAFMFYTLDVMTKVQQDIKYIKHNIEKNI